MPTKLNRILPILILLIAATVAASALADDGVSREVSETYAFSAGDRLTLSEINGSVVIEGWDRNEVLMEATLHAADQKMLDQLEIKVEAKSGRLDIETEYPNSRGWWNNGSHASVDFRIKVPRGAHLADVSLVNGHLAVSGIQGDIEASMVNGRLKAEDLRGNAELSTVNGPLIARFERLGSGQRLDLSSVNGPVDLYLPADLDADIDASTVHGRIRNDLGIEVERGEYVGQSLQARFGAGGAKLEVSNVNGPIEIHQE